MAGAYSPLTVASELLTLARDALDACDAEPLNRVHVAAGLVAWDDCCGMLVAAPERVYRTASFPIEGPDAAGCFDGLIAVDCVVLLVRCVPVLDDRGNPPSVGALQDAYASILWEAGVIWNALRMVDVDAWETTGEAQTFVGAEGGCIGVETRITVGIDQEQWCPGCGEVTGG